MGAYLFKMFGVSLALTLVIEVALAWVCRIRRGKQILLVCLANILTNPAVVFLAWIWRMYFPDAERLIFYALAEAAAVLTEGLIYRAYMKGLKHPMLFSVFANGCSFLIGTAVS